MHPLAMPLDSVLLPRSLRPLRLELWWSRACLIAFVVPVALGAFGDPDCLELEDLTIACLSFEPVWHMGARESRHVVGSDSSRSFSYRTKQRMPDTTAPEY